MMRLQKKLEPLPQLFLKLDRLLNMVMADCKKFLGVKLEKNE